VHRLHHGTRYDPSLGEDDMTTRQSGIYSRQSKQWQPGQVMLPPAPASLVDMFSQLTQVQEDISMADIVAEDDSSDNTRDDTDPCFQQPIPVAGYAFLASSYEVEDNWYLVARGDDINDIPNDDWEHCILSENEEATYVGRRSIDGTCCNVWYSPSWKGFIAQIMHGR
jgi:hypothetical protein